jgi:hypothetical protein
MSASGAASTSAWGFLTVVEHPQHGLFGGYLVLNSAARPLEFHCTTPLKPNRAQEILYGPTLRPYLYGEQIGQALLAKGTAQPLLLCTDQQDVLAARSFAGMPLALVLPEEAETPPDSTAGGSPSGAVHQQSLRVDAAHAGLGSLTVFHAGRRRLAVEREHRADEAIVRERLTALSEHFDLQEPFERIREAIEEAQRTSR